MSYEITFDNLHNNDKNSLTFRSLDPFNSYMVNMIKNKLEKGYKFTDFVRDDNSIIIFLSDNCGYKIL